MTYRILVGSYTSDVTTLEFDPDASTLRVASALTVGHHPSWLTRHPSDPSLVYTGLEQAGGKILVFKIDTEGAVTVVGEASGGGEDPASLEALDKELIVGNYSSGNVAIIPISTSPSIHPEPTAVHQLPFSKAGPNADRQLASHPHQIVPVLSRNMMLVPDLGADRTWIFEKRGDSDEWHQTGSLLYKPGDGPRHLVHHDNVAYTLCELTSTVSTHRLDTVREDIEPLTHASTMFTPPSPLGDMLAAEILLYPPPPASPSASYQPRFLYISNRNFPGEVGDPIAIFSLENPLAPKLVRETASGLEHVRGMVVSPDGKYLVAGGVHGGGVKIYDVREDGGALEQVAHCELEGPTHFLWL
ncbi:putative isomerase YbhE [Peniophora sp. CONT]|nr:putative isomerase YbhE [Peniophora sp. CONT]